jgi:hypothetical protein
MKRQLTGEPRVTLEVPVLIKRRAQEVRLVLRPDDGAAPPEVDGALVQLVLRAHRAGEALRDQADLVAPSQRPHLTRIARFSYLAPDIIAAIMDGKQPADLSVTQMVRAPIVPVCWQAQRGAFGFI